mgnify:CR=1 FL=1
MLMSDSNDILAIRHLFVIMLCCISYFEGCPDVYIYICLCFIHLLIAYLPKGVVRCIF